MASSSSDAKPSAIKADNGNDTSAQPTQSASTALFSNPPALAATSPPIKPTVIGIYGLPGAGKTYLLNALKKHAQLKDHPFAFYNGGDVINAAIPIGEFYSLTEDEQATYRSNAISTISKFSKKDHTTAVVTGHCLFWPKKNEEALHNVWTDSDAAIYTHMLYLDVDVGKIARRRAGDISKTRPKMSAEQLAKWQNEEKALLRKLCYESGILFIVIRENRDEALSAKGVPLLLDFVEHSEEKNLARAEERLDEVIVQMRRDAGDGLKLQRMLVIDGDRTLTAQDTGSQLWSLISSSNNNPSPFSDDPLTAIFSSPLGYSYAAFRQAMLVYEELSATGPESLKQFIDQAATKTTLYDDFLYLLRKAGKQYRVGAVVITCGLKQVWETIIRINGLSSTIEVIGGGRITDGLVITAKVKAAVAFRLKTIHSLETWAIGDSVLDIGMLSKADRAVVVVGAVGSRSESVEQALATVIDAGILQNAWQVIMAKDAPARLTTKKLPVTTMSQLTEAILDTSDFTVHHATNKAAAKVLMTRTRDSSVFGPALRKAHRRVGWHLAHEYLTEIIGLETTGIIHVQGHAAEGHQLLNEGFTLIIALMRGGEPMAFGVNDAFPLATFLHAKEPEQLTAKHLASTATIILVDSVINTGKSILEFLDRISELEPKHLKRVVIVAGVVQEEAVEKLKSHLVHKPAGKGRRTSLVALRLSKNKFTGKGSTDTGHRLFNTAFLDRAAVEEFLSVC